MPIRKIITGNNAAEIAPLLEESGLFHAVELNDAGNTVSCRGADGKLRFVLKTSVYEGNTTGDCTFYVSENSSFRNNSSISTQHALAVICVYTCSRGVILDCEKGAVLLTKNVTPPTVLKADSLHHIWSPELHRLAGKWYLYFEADAGNTDNHQLYVLENTSENPMEGEYRMKGAIKTNDEWNFGLHPTSIVVRGQQYLLWSGWQHRRSETETQCIYIARMQNPWTLSSERVLLSMPELEWERQWINPNGDRSNYPIFVNENPEAFLTPNEHYVCVCYSASGIWTVYNTLGMLYARADDDLLDAHSWTKMQEPVLRCVPDSAVFGISDISVVPSADGQHHYFLFEAKQYDDEGNFHRNVQMRPLNWNNEGLPEF